MSVFVKRRKGESFEALLRRFSRRTSASGNILEKKKKRYHQDAENKNAQKASALRRMEIAEKREYLMKVGKLVEDKRRGRRRR